MGSKRKAVPVKGRLSASAEFPFVGITRTGSSVDPTACARDPLSPVSPSSRRTAS